MQLIETSIVAIDEADVVIDVIVVSEDGTGINAKQASSSHDDDDDDDDDRFQIFSNELVIKLLLNAYSKNANRGG